MQTFLNAPPLASKRTMAALRLATDTWHQTGNTVCQTKSELYTSIEANRVRRFCSANEPLVYRHHVPTDAVP